MAQTTPALVPSLSRALVPEELSERQRAAVVRELSLVLDQLPASVGPLRFFLLLMVCGLVPPAVLPVSAWVVARTRRRAKLLEGELASRLRELGLGDALTHHVVEAARAAARDAPAPESPLRDGLSAMRRSLRETPPELLDELTTLEELPRLDRALRRTTGARARALGLIGSALAVFAPAFAFGPGALTVASLAFVPVAFGVAVTLERLPGWLLPSRRRHLRGALRGLFTRFGSLEAARQLAGKKPERP